MRFARVIAASLVLLLASKDALADRLDQKAADLYADGRDLIKKGKYKEGAEKIKAALARGATEPNEMQGSEGRYKVRDYDPYYWLGVAQMEMGQLEQALANFEKSETTLPVDGKVPLIRKLKTEYADLQQRKKVLEAKLGGAAVPPTAVIAAAQPTHTPVVIAALPPTARPTEPPAPTPTTIVLSIHIPTAAIPAGLPTAIPTPAESPLFVAVKALKVDYERWLAQPAIGPAARTELGSHVEKLATTIAAAKTPDSALKKLLDDEKRYFEKSAAPVLRRASLTAGIEALASQKWKDAQGFIELARKAEPKAPQPDLLECTLLATRYVLEGKSDAQKIQAARDSLKLWRSKVGQARELPPFLSPSLREVLQ